MTVATKALIAAIAAALPSSSPPPTPLSPWSSLLPKIPSPPLPLPSPPLPLPVPSSPLLLPATGRKEDVLEADVPPQKRLCLAASTLRFEVEENATPRCLMKREVGYGITDVWDDMVGDMEETAPTTLEAVNQRVADLATTLTQDTHETYVQFEDVQDHRAFLRAQINMIRRDLRYFNAMVVAFEKEAMYAHRAWAGYEDRSATIEAHVKTLETQVATLMAQTSSLQT
ncbi:hypothetical protein Tco_1481190 [Tanacetum coccineum]